ncbi:MAG TPA: alpha/beta fold hydrolase [Candidatus Binatia bacterium]|nr:alpha/beta fold hydrolase [Candidatus Binatia bacterium]
MNAAGAPPPQAGGAAREVAVGVAVDTRSDTALGLIALVGVLLVASACATPIGVVRADPQKVHRALTRSVMTAGKPSAATEQTLQRLGLAERFEEDPAGTLGQLRGAGTDLNRNRLFALAELSFLYAEREHRQDHYLAAAVYAYAFLFESKDESALALDPRTRLAADLYNFGLGLGLVGPPAASNGAPAPSGRTAAEAEAVEVILSDRTLPLPFGQLELRGDPADFLWGPFRMSRFVSVGDFEVRGLRNRYRQPGIGAPLAAEVTPAGTGPEAEAARKYIPARVKVPVTVFVRLENVVEAIANGRLRGRIELYPADEATTVEVQGRTLPLELEPSATLAYGLEGAPVWDTELGSFLSAEFRRSFAGNLAMIHPYRPGRVPVVLIHGTASSPARWADMVNELSNDPVLRSRIQFWLFTYSTSSPILVSASELRRSLQSVVKELDPEGRDPALRRMVLIGHSQGGLLARLMVTDSGTRFWDSVTKLPFAEVKASPETRELVRNTMFFEPLPFVSRVVFIATPHRGSFRVSTFVMNLVRRVVTLPITLVKDVNDLARQNPDLATVKALEGTPTAVDNMRPGHHFIRTLSESPIAPGVLVHSIIAVLGVGPVSGKTDGVVAYESAHLDGVASEKIVRSSHSTQAEPETILEVRRILREHVESR